MRNANWRRGRFDSFDDQPLAEMPNLLDIMLVFACGLIAALASGADQLSQQGGQDVVQGREIPDVPRGVGEPTSGYESVGQVYRDPKPGKMILIGPAAPSEWRQKSAAAVCLASTTIAFGERFVDGEGGFGTFRCGDHS